MIAAKVRQPSKLKIIVTIIDHYSRLIQCIGVGSTGAWGPWPHTMKCRGVYAAIEITNIVEAMDTLLVSK